MVTDSQVRMLMKLVNQEKLLKTAAAKAGMGEKPPASTANRESYPASARRSTTGAPAWIRSIKTIGVGSRRCSIVTTVSRPRRSSRFSNENTPASTRMGNYARFSGE
jgi:hypothetical protein